MIDMRPVERSLAGRQVFQPIQRQPKTVLHAEFLEEPAQVDLKANRNI
jgi:hypothetical protein